MAAKKKQARLAAQPKVVADEATTSGDSNEEDSPDENAEPAEKVFTVAVLQEEDGSEPFTRWFHSLRDREARQRILARIAVVRRGSLGLMRPVGEGVSELKIDYAAGYRLYFGRKGNTLVILIVGGDKDSQATDIVRAQTLWKRYRDEIENV